MKNKKVPIRTCVGCRQAKPKKELIRMVNREGRILIDKTGKANGRGIYLCNNRECFELARKKKAISRGLDISFNDEELDQLFIDFFEKKYD